MFGRGKAQATEHERERQLVTVLLTNRGYGTPRVHRCECVTDECFVVLFDALPLVTSPPDPSPVRTAFTAAIYSNGDVDVTDGFAA